MDSAIRLDALLPTLHSPLALSTTSAGQAVIGYAREQGGSPRLTVSGCTLTKCLPPAMLAAVLPADDAHSVGVTTMTNGRAVVGYWQLDRTGITSHLLLCNGADCTHGRTIDLGIRTRSSPGETDPIPAIALAPGRGDVRYFVAIQYVLPPPFVPGREIMLLGCLDDICHARRSTLISADTVSDFRKPGDLGQGAPAVGAEFADWFGSLAVTVDQAGVPAVAWMSGEVPVVARCDTPVCRKPALNRLTDQTANLILDTPTRLDVIVTDDGRPALNYAADDGEAAVLSCRDRTCDQVSPRGVTQYGTDVSNSSPDSPAIALSPTGHPIMVVINRTSEPSRFLLIRCTDTACKHRRTTSLGRPEEIAAFTVAQATGQPPVIVWIGGGSPDEGVLYLLRCRSDGCTAP